MTSSNGIIFRVTGPLERPVTRDFDVFLIWGWTNGWANTRDAGDLIRHRAHYGVIVMRRLTTRSREILKSRHLSLELYRLVHRNPLSPIVLFAVCVSVPKHKIYKHQQSLMESGTSLLNWFYSTMMLLLYIWPFLTRFGLRIVGDGKWKQLCKKTASWWYVFHWWCHYFILQYHNSIP